MRKYVKNAFVLVGVVIADLKMELEFCDCMNFDKYFSHAPQELGLGSTLSSAHGTMCIVSITRQYGRDYCE